MVVFDGGLGLYLYQRVVGLVNLTFISAFSILAIPVIEGSSI